MPRKKIAAYKQEEEAVPTKPTIKFKADLKLSESQHEFYTKIMENKIVVGTGYFGSSKTFTSCYAALKLLSKNKIEKIIITKPIVEAGNDGESNIGFLKGDLNQKIEPYAQSFYQNIEKMLESKQDLTAIRVDKQIEFLPVEYFRGRSEDNTLIIADEAQSFNLKQLMLLATRIGKNSKLVFIGDEKQADISSEKVALNFFKDRIINGLEECATHTFEKMDIVRDPLIIRIAERYEDLEKSGQIPSSEKPRYRK